MLVHLSKYPLTYTCATLNSRTVVCIGVEFGQGVGGGNSGVRSLQLRVHAMVSVNANLLCVQ